MTYIDIENAVSAPGVVPAEISEEMQRELLIASADNSAGLSVIHRALDWAEFTGNVVVVGNAQIQRWCVNGYTNVPREHHARILDLVRRCSAAVTRTIAASGGKRIAKAGQS